MTSMEKFHWLDQNPELPNFIFATLRFATPIDPEVARRSLAIGLRRQPMAAMEPTLADGRWHWKSIPNIQYDGDRVFCSRCVNDADNDGDSVKSLEPQHELGREFVSCFLSVVNFSESHLQGDEAPSGDQLSPSENESSENVMSEIRFHSHHAASDGVASVGLVNDWLTIYNNLVAGEPAENGLVALDSSSFEKRGVLGLLSWNYLKGLPQQAIALFGAAKFIFRKTKNITAETPAIKSSPVYPAIRGTWIDATTLKEDRRQASENQVGFTAWCLAKCFIAIDCWNQERQAKVDNARPDTTASAKATSQAKSILFGESCCR